MAESQFVEPATFARLPPRTNQSGRMTRRNRAEARPDAPLLFDDPRSPLIEEGPVATGDIADLYPSPPTSPPAKRPYPEIRATARAIAPPILQTVPPPSPSPALSVADQLLFEQQLRILGHDSPPTISPTRAARARFIRFSDFLVYLALAMGTTPRQCVFDVFLRGRITDEKTTPSSFRQAPVYLILQSCSARRHIRDGTPADTPDIFALKFGSDLIEISETLSTAFGVENPTYVRSHKAWSEEADRQVRLGQTGIFGPLLPIDHHPRLTPDEQRSSHILVPDEYIQSATGKTEAELLASPETISDLAGKDLVLVMSDVRAFLMSVRLEEQYSMKGPCTIATNYQAVLKRGKVSILLGKEEIEAQTGRVAK